MKKLSFVLFIITIISFSCNVDIDEKPSVDLFIWAGQSNAQGRQGDATHYPNDIDSLDKDILFNWTKIDDTKSNGWVTMSPQEGNFPNGHFGAEVSFSRKLKQAEYNPAIFKYTKTATSIYEHWLKPGEGGFYDDMVADLNTAIEELKDKGYKVNIKGFIWIQGESDAKSDESAATYNDNLNAIVKDIRNTTNVSNLPILLGVDEQFFNLPDFSRTEILNAHLKLASSDPNIKFTSMYGYPKADVTHLTPAGLVSYGEAIFESFQLLVTGKKPSSKCTVSSDGDIISILTKKAWGQSFKLDCSGTLDNITFDAASNLNNPATFTLHNGIDCSGEVIFSIPLNSIKTGINTITSPSTIYLDKEHTYYMNISSDTDTGWKIHYRNTNNVIGNLRTNRNNQDNTTCNWNFLNFDMNFSVNTK